MERRGGRTSQIASPDGESRRHKPDLLILAFALAISALGLIVIYSLSPAIAARSDEPENYYFVRHAISLLIGLLAMGAMYVIPLKGLKLSSYIFGVVSLLASVVIIALDGLEFRWIKIGGLSFQPAETFKLSLLLWISFFLASRIKDGSIKDFKKVFKPIAIAVGIIAVVLVLIQKDLGSMVVAAAIAVSALFVSGARLKPLFLVMMAGVVLVALAIVSTPYRRDRFETFLKPQQDCEVEGYQACQALIAVGSGGLLGLGVGNSVQAYGYLPATVSDSVFAIYAEKFGFVGSALFVILVGALVFRLIAVAKRTTNWESRLIMVGIITWISVQTIINIGGMIGMMPLKGITLPLMSYGGSSLIFVMMSIGVALRISCYTSVRNQTLETGTKYENIAIRRGDRRTYNAPFGSR